MHKNCQTRSELESNISSAFPDLSETRELPHARDITHGISYIQIQLPLAKPMSSSAGNCDHEHLGCHQGRQHVTSGSKERKHSWSLVSDKPCLAFLKGTWDINQKSGRQHRQATLRQHNQTIKQSVPLQPLLSFCSTLQAPHLLFFLTRVSCGSTFTIKWW